ncbi:hypothetical protein Poli38472_012689 [Pythium oligandrum]|uniref:Uncharacterized protein n=1 Tax=Pythium oligandrum TaxID=41045 RepID=A0A8K1FK88_PYTOL|nr:hypothetical protein Poli38472_012689 [Pythium oligandrum]|eukprot:TMW61498.1 hypothetical protein Poli38472_012689 [Pythium oligandrum]
MPASSSSFSSSDDDFWLPVTTEEVSDDFCAYNETETLATGCKRPRNCEQCLRVKGCMVDPEGKCVSMAHYDEDLDFRGARRFLNRTTGLTSSFNSTRFSARNNMTQYYDFPALTVNYCDSNDRFCAICRSRYFPNMTHDSRFCAGEDGCICISMCDGEAADAAIAAATVCETADEGDPSRPPAHAQYALVIGASIAIVICCSIYFWFYRRSKALEAADEAQIAHELSNLTKDDEEKASSHASVISTEGLRFPLESTASRD